MRSSPPLITRLRRITRVRTRSGGTVRARRTRAGLGSTALAGILACAPLAAGAQAIPGGDEPPGWDPITVGAHFGYDQSSNGEVVGLQLRLPVVRGGSLELAPSGNVTFLSRLREYHLNVDAVWVSGGRRGGPYVAAGLAVRNSIFDVEADAERETIVGYGGAVGIQTSGTLGTQVELRWIFMPGTDFDPRVITLGVNIPLWGRDGDS